MTYNVVCFNCGKTPAEIDEYSPEQTGEDTDNLQYVIENEGTFNPSNGHFCCTSCYIVIGMPSSPTGWVAP